MNRQLILTAATAAVSFAATSTLAQQTVTLQHTNSISLSSLFNSTSDYGTIGLSVAFDGTNAYVGGYRNVGSAGNVGIVKVSDVLTAAPSAAGVAGTQAPVNSLGLRGYDTLVSDGTSVYAAMDTGDPATSFIARFDTNLNQIWKTLSPSGVRPNGGLAIDPTADAGSPALGFLSQGNGRRLALKLDGSLLYASSAWGGPEAKGALIDSTPSLGFSYRGLAFDPTGAIAISEDSGLAVGNRVSDNQFTGLTGTGNTTRVVLKSSAQNNVGNGVALLEGAGASSLLVFSPRVAGSGTATANVTLTDSAGGTTIVNSGDIQIRNKDGTPTGITQTSLRGNEDGIGNAYSTEVKNFAVAKDANGLPILLATSALENRLDVYQMEPTYIGDADATWSAGTWFANVVPNAATLNARFAPTTAPRTITVDAGQTTKNLKIDSASAYTFTGGPLNIDAPAGQNGNIQVLQGSHTIQNALNLAKTTVVSAASASTLTISGPITGAAGLSKIGLGDVILSATTSINGPLGLTGGTLTVNAPVTGVTRINASATVPATLNVNAPITLAPSGTDAATSRISADTNLAISNTGRVDLADNDAVFDYASATNIDSVRSLLAAGRANGAWNGNGGLASSSAAASNGATALGYAEASLLLGLTDTNTASFSGQTVDATTVLVKYTYAGDANLDGVINGDDFALLDKGRANNVANAHWTDGDFTYDGAVTSADYLVIDTAYSKQTGPLSPSLLASRSAEFGDAYVSQLIAAVPEPTSLLAACGLALLPLKRRRKS